MRRPIPHLFRSLALAAAAVLADPSAQAQDAAPQPNPALGRPRVGLVLSGGGARGLAHVGVLKVLERERVPVDVIAGTSMGAIIGGLYASGMRADEIEAELLKVNWESVFASRVDRQQLSQRRKEEDFEISPLIEFGLRDGEFRAPLGALSGRGLETLLRRYTLPVREVRDFDRLPLRFRAVATDLESGGTVVLDRGDLALALRSSMSVPGVFAPTELDGRLLGDGGLVKNLPVDVARGMGADVVIAVNIGTPLAARETLSSVAGLTAQMINILTEQNVQRSIESLKPGDVLISPDLGPLTSADFARTRELIDRGERGALPLVPRLASLALAPQAYAAWRAEHPRAPRPQAQLSFVRFEGAEISNPQRYAPQLESRAGQPFDPAKAERDARRLAASGDYMRADYRLVKDEDGADGGDGLVFELDEKPWGPNYFRVGLDLSTDFAGRSAFNLKISHNRHWLDASGTEWRNQVQIGEVPRWSSELYHPLNWTLGLSNDWFVSANTELSLAELVVYDRDSGDEQGRYRRSSAHVGLDLGQPWGEFGELRIGALHLVQRTTPDIVAAGATALPAQTVRETGLRLGAVVDQLDFANFPQRGYRIESEAVFGRRGGGGTANSHFGRFKLQGTAAGTWNRHTLSAHGRALYTGDTAGSGVGRYALGGWHQLSGYKPGQIEGNYLLFGRLTYYRRLEEVPVFTRGLFFGGTLEAGNAWATRSSVRMGDLRHGGSLFVGADTGLGPVYFGLTYAAGGSAGLYLFIGRP
mgnify:CR=1 FL=1